jgi:hypothetical protein
MTVDELRRLVEQKTNTVRVLEELLEQEDAVLVELERELEEMEDGEGDGRTGHGRQTRNRRREGQ